MAAAKVMALYVPRKQEHSNFYLIVLLLGKNFERDYFFLIYTLPKPGSYKIGTSLCGILERELFGLVSSLFFKLR
jgi:hypothetical protein